MVLNTQTNINGLSAPSHDTRLKLKMRISTPTSSRALMWVKIRVLRRFIVPVVKLPESFFAHVKTASFEFTISPTLIIVF